MPAVDQSAVTMKDSQRRRSTPTLAPGWIEVVRKRRMQRLVRHQMKERENWKLGFSR